MTHHSFACRAGLVLMLCSLTMLGILPGTARPSFASDGGGEIVGSASRTSLGGWPASSDVGNTIRADIVGRNAIESPISNEMSHLAENHGRKDAAMPPAVTVKNGPHGGPYGARGNDIAGDVTSPHGDLAGKRGGPGFNLACATISMGGGVTDNGSIGIIGQPLAGTMSSAEFTIEVGFVACLAAGVPVGCGACQLFGDVFPFTAASGRTTGVGNCVVDIDDLLVTLGAFAISPFATKDTGGPFPNEVDLFPCGGLDGVVDIDDIVAILGAFGGDYACPHVCNPGVCCGTLTDNLGNTVSCLDWDQSPGEQTPPGGMSEDTCNALGGVFIEDMFPNKAVCQGDGNGNGTDDVCPGG